MRFSVFLLAFFACLATLERLGNTIAKNHNIILMHLDNGNWTKSTKLLTWSAAASSGTWTDSTLDDLIRERMVQKEERLETILTVFNCVLDTPELLNMITQAGRIEKVRQRLEGKIQNLEDKMDQILGVLSAFASLPVFTSSTSTSTAVVPQSEIPAQEEPSSTQLPIQG